MSESAPRNDFWTLGHDGPSDSVSTVIAPEADLIREPTGTGLSENLPPLTPPNDKTVISKRLLVPDPSPPPLPNSQTLGAALVGKKFGNYELIEFVGGGGMGAVFKATDSSLGRTVAVKVLSRDHTDEETIRRFRNEAQSAARLDHPNIARAYYVGEHEGWNFIVFEFVQGTNLRDLVEKQGPLPIEQALNYTLQVAQALEHAAGRDVVHRDIKPSNVLVTPAGEIKLVDMGLARLHQVESSSDDLTASGVTLGTFDYISPEQARDPRAADARSDIYSLGCTLYFMLAGRPPFPDGTALQKLLWHSGEDPPDPRRFRPEIPPHIIRLLEKMLAKRPTQRPQSPRELMGEINAVADELGFAGFGGAGNRFAPAPPAASAWSKAASILVPIAVLVLLIVLVDAWRPDHSASSISLRPRLREPTSVAQQQGKNASPATASPAKTESKAPAGPPQTTRPAAAEQPGAASASSIPKMPVSPEEGTLAPAETKIVKPSAPDVAGSDSLPPPAIATPEAPAKAVESSAALAAAAPLSAELRAEPAETTSLSSAGNGSGSVSKPKITRLVVRPDGKPPAALLADQEVVRSLARACQRAAELGIQEIELQFSGETLEQPLEISSARLTIKAAAGEKPIVVFRPQQLSLASDKQMIRLAGGSTGRISFQGIELRMDLPAEPASGWALFAIYQIQSLDLSDCILTVKDTGSAGVPIHYEVAFFALQPRRITDTMKMMDDDTRMTPAMGVNLARCVARGEATFLIAMEESPLKVVWTQGLLVTNQRLIETGGSPLKTSEFDRLDVDLDHVTAIIPQGLYSMKRRASSGYQLKVDIRARNCLIQTSVESPLFEFADLSAIEDVKLAYSGEGNLYPRKRGLFLRFRPQSKSDPPAEHDFENRSRWATERDFGAGIVWQEPPPTFDKVPAHRQKPRSYLLDPDARNQAGFDRGSLPEPSEPVAEKAVTEGEGD